MKRRLQASTLGSLSGIWAQQAGQLLPTRARKHSASNACPQGRPTGLSCSTSPHAVQQKRASGVVSEDTRSCCICKSQHGKMRADHCACVRRQIHTRCILRTVHSKSRQKTNKNAVVKVMDSTRDMLALKISQIHHVGIHTPSKRPIRQTLSTRKSFGSLKEIDHLRHHRMRQGIETSSRNFEKPKTQVCSLRTLLVKLPLPRHALNSK